MRSPIFSLPDTLVTAVVVLALAGPALAIGRPRNPPPPPAPPPPSSPDGAALVALDLPARLAPGETRAVTIRMRNTGSAAWSAADGVKLGAVGDASSDAARIGPGRVELPPGAVVAPGAEHAFQLTVTAPAAPGVYRPRWQMVREHVRWFGATVAATVEVGAGGPPVARDARVWFTPNIASLDLLDLFARPGAWQGARARIDVVKLYHQQTRPGACPTCGPNTHAALVSADAFAKLDAWGIDLAIELGAIKEWGCRGAPMADDAIATIDEIARAGGRVRYLSMDEPLLGGQHTVGGRSCGMSRDRIAVEVADYIRRVRASHPEVEVGDIEPYPHFSAAELVAWLETLERVGASLAFFHLDVDMNHVEQVNASLERDLRALRDHRARRAIPFGVIIIGRPDDDDRRYHDHAMAFAQRVKAAIGRPDQLVFQSWIESPRDVRQVPTNLPEGEPFTHTRLVAEGLDFFSR